nr:MAG TPA: hypothetical protein [Caudoviricetes sp.]
MKRVLSDMERTFYFCGDQKSEDRGQRLTTNH